MGHMHLNSMPDTALWGEVINLVADDAEVVVVAAATTKAAVVGLEAARDDPGIGQTVFQLTQVVLAARQLEFAEGLRNAGISISENPNAFELTAGLGEAIDRRLQRAGRTDLGEMSRLAAVEAFTALLNRKATNLFETTPDEVWRATRELSTQVGFSTLAHEFYSRFIRRFLTYHLGRELGLHVGGNGVFDGPADHDAFVERLSVHCREAAAITRTYAGDWYSKHNFEGGINLGKAKNFVAVCLEKLTRELLKRGERHG
jgi:hypothetical protein